MNEQLQARIQEYITAGKNPSWIANELYFEDESIDYDGILNYASGLIDESKKKDLESPEATTTPLIASVPSEEELASSPPAQDLSVSGIGREYAERFAADQAELHASVFDDEEFNSMVSDIRSTDKTDEQKSFEIQQAINKKASDKQKDLLSRYSDEINNRIGEADVDKEDYANRLYSQFGLAIPLDGDDRYNETTGFGGGVWDFFRDNAVELGMSTIDFLSGPMSSAAAAMPGYMSAEVRESYKRSIDQELSDFTEKARTDYTTQYTTGFVERATDINSIGDVAELVTRSTRAVSGSAPYIAAAALGPVGIAVGGTVAASNTYQDSEREDLNRIQQGLEPVFDDTAKGEAARIFMSVADGALTAGGGSIQSSILKRSFKNMISNPLRKETATEALRTYLRHQGLEALSEGGVEGLQEASRMLSEDIGGNVDYTGDDYFDRWLEATVMGIASSGTIAAPGGARRALDAGADAVRRPQAAVNSRVEKSGMTSKDQQNVESLNKSQSVDPLLSKNFDQQLQQEKATKETFYRMMTLRHPKEMERINNIDIAIEQATIRYKNAQKQGVSDVELEALTGNIFTLVDQRMRIVNSHSGESTDLNIEERRKYEDSRVAHRMDNIRGEVAVLKESLDEAMSGAVGVDTDPRVISDLSDRLNKANDHRKEALRLLGVLGEKRSVLRDERGASQTQAGMTEELTKAAEEAYIAEQDLRNHLGLKAINPNIEEKAPEVTQQYSAAAQLENHNADQEAKGSTFTLDGINQAGQEKTSVSIFPERSKIVEGDISAEDLEAFVKDNNDLFEGNEDVISVGTWFDANDNKTYIDVAATVDKEVGIELGKQYNQKAVWDLKNMEEIDTGGTGTAEGDLKPEAERVADIRNLVKPVEPKVEPTKEEVREQPQEKVASRGIDGEFDEFQAKSDGSLAITSIPGLTKKDIRVINKMLAPALKAAAGSNFKVVVHNTQESGDRSSNVVAPTNALAVNNPDGSIEIHLNAKRLAESRKSGKDPRAVIVEEVLHTTIGPALRKAYKNNPKVVYGLIDELEGIARSSGKEELVSIVEQKGDLYRKVRNAKEQEVTEEQIVEYFTELLNYDYSDPNLLDRIRVAINKFMKATLGRDAMLIEDISQAKPILQKLQRSLKTGEAFVVSETAAETTTERAALSPSKLPESGSFKIKYVRGVYDRFGGPSNSFVEEKTFNGKWDFINWWKYATDMGKGKGSVRYGQFELVKPDGSTEPVNADVMKSWKLRPPVYKEDKARVAKEKDSIKRDILPKFTKLLNIERRKTKGEPPYMGKDYISALERIVKNMDQDRVDAIYEIEQQKVDKYYTKEDFAYDIIHDYATLEEVQEAYQQANEEFGVDDSDGVTERAAYAFTDRIVSDPEVSTRYQAQLRDKARALCAVGAGTCSINDKSSLLQMESSLVKQQIGDNPTLEQSVDIAAQSLDILRQHLIHDHNTDVADAVGNYEEGRSEVMKSIAADESIEVNPMDFKMMYDLLVSYTSNGSQIDPNLNLSLQLFKAGLKRVQSGATEFISPGRIEAISKREQDGTLGMVRGDRANTMAKHLSDINEIFKQYYVDGKLNEEQFIKSAKKRDSRNIPALASMIGANTTKLADLYLGNTGDKNAIPKDGHFRDQFNVFRGRFNQVDYSEGLVIPEDVRTSAIARLNALGADVNAMASDAEVFATIRDLKSKGDDKVRNGAARIYKELVGNQIERLRDFDVYDDSESTLFVKKVARKMGLTPFQVQQLMYHDGVYSMSSYQGRPFISDYKSAMERSIGSDANTVGLDAVPGDQLALSFDNVDPITEKVMPTPGRKLNTKLEGKTIDAAENSLFRTRTKDVGTTTKVRGASVKISKTVVDEALSTDATSRRILAKGVNIEPGKKVGIRLNLNVMKNTGVPVQTVHDKTASGEALTYAPAVTVKNVELYVNQNAREKIVTFQENKFPMASVNGEFVGSGTDLNYDGVRVKFNPFSHNVFVDMAGRPVKSAEEATIIGNDVYLRGKIEYYDMSDPILERGTIESEESRIKRTTRGAKYDKAVARFEGYAKGVLGMEFDSREALEAAYDNMVVPSDVAVSESQVAANMADAVERASIATATKKKMRQTASRQKGRFDPDIRTKIVKDPRNYITPQKLKSLKKDVQDLTDQELIDIVNDEQLGRISTMNDNLGVLAQAERLARAVARGEADIIPDLIAEMSSMGTTAGRLLRHFREVKRSSPKGLVSIITAAAEAKGNKLTEEQAKRLDDLAGQMFQAQAQVEDLETRAIRGEKVGKELEDAVKRLKAVEREMDTFTNVVIERGWGELLGQIAQGNLLTTMSQVTNIEANGVNSILDVGVDITAAPVKAFMSSLSKLAGKEYDADRRVSLGAYFYAMSHMGKNFVDTIDQVITGQDKDTTEWRQSRGLMPFRSMMAAISGKDIPPSQRLKLAVQGSFGVPAEVMFRLLSLGDTPFRKYFEDKNLYEQGMEMGLEGEALADFLKHPPRKNAEKARGAGRRITFQEETAFSKGVNESIGFVERKMGEALDMLPYINGEQTAKALLRFMIPFRSTPANILIESATFASPIVAAARASSEMKKGNLDEASRHVAKAMIGAVVTETAVMLLSEGILSGPVQWDEDEEKNLAYDQFPPTSINISALKRMLSGEDASKQDDDVFVNYMKLGLPGALMAAVAVGYDKEEVREREYDGAIDFAKHMFSDMVSIGPLTAAGSMMEQSFLQGLNDFLQILAGGEVERSSDNLLNSIANVGMSVILPNQFSAIYRAQREFLPDRRITKDMDRAERLMANLEYTIKDRTFGGADIPVRVDWKGNPIKQNPRGNVGWMYQLFDVTKLRQGEDDPVSQEIYRLFESTETVSKVVSTPSFAKKRKVSVPDVTSKKELMALRMLGKNYTFLNDEKFVQSGVYFNTEQMNSLMAVAGKERYQDVENLMNSVQYEMMNDDEKVEALDEINDKYNSVKEFDGRGFRNHTVAILDIMQEIYESGNQED